jgi:hypothetical protein
MDNQAPDNPVRRFLRWATTQPQAYVVYLIVLILVWVLSFYAGTLKPKKAEGIGPPPVTAPQR